ncbi:MAG: tetratricopeptide repeat protein [Candidatus Latescibacterota bacterium]|nr:MAG: tetratricopeptide repeat protein [Candidatus Latescibacterota bacterium]
MFRTRYLVLALLWCMVSSCQDMALHYYNRGIDAMEQDDPSAAVEFFEKSLEARPSDPDTHMNLGVAYHAVGNYDAAITEFKIALDTYPSDPVLHFNMG